MNVAFEEIGRLAVTFGQNGCAAGHVCRIGSDGRVIACAAGEKFCGVVESVRGDYAAVQLEGFVTVKVTGTVTVGFAVLCADGNGGVKSGAGREFLVVQVDTSAGTAVIKL